MKFDEFLFSHLGEMGRYQKIQFLLVTIPTMVCAFHAFHWTFASHNQPYRCALPTETSPKEASYRTNSPMIALDKNECYNTVTKLKVIGTDFGKPNISCNYEKCHLKGTNDTCQDYVFDHSQMAYTANEQWYIVCDRDIFKSIIQSSYYVGQLFGSIVFGILGDRIGRKKVFFIAIMLQMTAGLAMAIIPFWWLYIVFRFITGFAHPGIFVIAVVIGMELVGPSYRKLAGVISGGFYAIGQVILGSTAYFVTDYRWLHLAISAPAIIFLSYWWVLPESARWLVSLSRFEEADKVLQRAAKVNGVTLPERWWEQLDQEPTQAKAKSTKKYSAIDLFVTPQIRKRTLAVFFVWPVVSMIYYGLGIKPDVLGGDLYISFIMGALIEMPALVIVYMTIDRIGRRPVLASGFALAGVSLLINLLLPENLNQWVAITQLMIAKGSITAVYAAIYTFTPELFPTVLRNTAMGGCSMIARIGAISSSFISFWIVQRFGKIVMIIPFGGLALTASVVTLLFLPETMGKHLPETINEVEGTPLEQEMQPLNENKALE